MDQAISTTEQSQIKSETLTHVLSNMLGTAVLHADYQTKQLQGGTLGDVRLVAGIAETVDGRKLPYNVVLKIQKKWERYGDPDSWRREYDLYASDLGAAFSDTFCWPKCYHAELNNDETLVWMEYIDGVSGLNLTGETFFSEDIMYKILIVEDDLDIQELLHDFLVEAGYEIVAASNGVEALTLFTEQKFDLVLLDLMLPKIDGFGVCEVIRQKSDLPIVMLTALDGELEQMKGFDLQADDFITKPFSMPILVRKISAILRRSLSMSGDPREIIYRHLVLDLDAYKVTNNGILIELTSREFEILRELLLHTGKILTRKNLLEMLWKYDFYGDERIVDTHIKNLRRKLKDADYIETVRGVGYKIDKED